jgi:hypothetical protein
LRKSYPALPCRATDCSVPSGLIASGDLRFFSTPFKALISTGIYGAAEAMPFVKSFTLPRERTFGAKERVRELHFQHSVPQGRLNLGCDAILDNFQPSLRGFLASSAVKEMPSPNLEKRTSGA